MPHASDTRPLLWTAAGAAVCGIGLRILVLTQAVDQGGLLPQGSPLLLITVLLCLAGFGALWLQCLRLNPLPGTEACFAREGIWLFGRLAAAVLLFLGGVLRLTAAGEEAGSLYLWAALASMAAGLSMAVVALVRSRGPALFWLRLLLALSVGMNLVLRFQDWSHDPLVIHIVPMLLAYACSLVETALLSGFSLGAGHRRSSVLFGLAGACFLCMGLPDLVLGSGPRPGDFLTLLGPVIWGLAAALDLLRRSVQEEAAADMEASEKTP